MTADEEDGEAVEAAGAVGEDAAALLAVVTDVGDNIEAMAAVGGEEGWDEGPDRMLRLAGRVAWPEANAGLVALGRDKSAVGVDAEVHPGAVESRLNGLDDAGFTGSGSAVEEHDLAADWR